MNKSEIIKDAKSRMKKSVDAIREEMAKIRTGRASTALLDHLKIDYYGNPTPLNQVATVSAGEVIRIPIPPLTEERRVEMTKLVRAEGENGKVAIRNIRRDANHHLKELLKKKEIAEDEEKKALDDTQKLTDQYVEQLDKIVADKEGEIMEV